MIGGTQLAASSAGSSSSHTIAGISPSPNCVLVGFVTLFNVGGSVVTLNSIAGNGLTWSQPQNRTFTDGATGTARLCLITAQTGTEPTEGDITLGLSAAAQASWVLFQFDKVTAAAIVQTAQNGGTGTAVSVTLAGFGNADDNVAVLGVALYGDGSGSVTITFPDLSNVSTLVTIEFGNCRSRAAWGRGEDTSPDATLSTSRAWAAIALEVAAAPTVTPPVIVAPDPAEVISGNYLVQWAEA